MLRLSMMAPSAWAHLSNREKRQGLWRPHVRSRATTELFRFVRERTRNIRWYLSGVKGLIGVAQPELASRTLDFEPIGNPRSSADKRLLRVDNGGTVPRDRAAPSVLLTDRPIMRWQDDQLDLCLKRF